MLVAAQCFYPLELTSTLISFALLPAPSHWGLKFQLSVWVLLAANKLTDSIRDYTNATLS